MPIEEDAASYFSHLNLNNNSHDQSTQLAQFEYDTSDGEIGDIIDSDKDSNFSRGVFAEDSHFGHVFPGFDIVGHIYDNPDAHPQDDEKDAPDAAEHQMVVDLPNGEDQTTESPSLDHQPSGFMLAGNPVDETTVLRDIERPHANDVKCARGNAANRHRGNQWYLERVKERKPAHSSAAGKPAKRRLAKEIVDLVRSRRPPGRFLKRDETTGLWSDIGDGNAIMKAGQALREDTPAQGQVDVSQSTVKKAGIALQVNDFINQRGGR
jgi:hypothetical protein